MECPCLPTNGHCVANLTCVCFPGLSGPNCDVTDMVGASLTRPVTLLSSSVGLIGFIVLAFATRQAFVFKRSRWAMIIMASASSLAGFAYYVSVLVAMSQLGEGVGRGERVGVAVAYVMGGIYYALSFVIHTYCLVFYHTLLTSQRPHTFKGMMKFWKAPIIITTLGAIGSEFYVSSEKVLHEASPLKYPFTKSGYLTQSAFRGVAFSTFATMVGVVTLIYTIRLWLHYDDMIPAPKGRQEVENKRKRNFVSPEYDHPGNEFEAPFVGRLRAVMMVMAVGELAFAVVGWIQLARLFAATDTSTFVDVLTTPVREYSFMIELVVLVAVFGFSPRGTTTLTTSAREYLEGAQYHSLTLSISLDGASGQSIARKPLISDDTDDHDSPEQGGRKKKSKSQSGVGWLPKSISEQHSLLTDDDHSQAPLTVRRVCGFICLFFFFFGAVVGIFVLLELVMKV